MRLSRSEVENVLSQTRVKADAPYTSGPSQIVSKLLEQARVASEHLTSRPEWDVFLQRVQALLDQEKRALDVMGESIAIPNLTSEQVLQAQRHMLAAKARIDAWEQVLQLPKQIIGTAEKATPEKAA